MRVNSEVRPYWQDSAQGWKRVVRKVLNPPVRRAGARPRGRPRRVGSFLSFLTFLQDPAVAAPPSVPAAPPVAVLSFLS